MTGSEKNKMQDIADRIERAKSTGQTTGRHFENHHSQAQHAWRMVIELVAGLVVGFGIGYGLDAIFETFPAFIIVFTLLGFLAGVRIMLKTANELQEQGLKAQEEEATNGE